MKTFSDIEDHWVEPTISELVKRQIIHFETGSLFYPEQKITTEQFVSWLVNSCHVRIANQWTYALEKGLAEDYDFVHREKPIERRQAARMVHDTLRIERKEKNEDDWAAAKELNDLYSCRTCVQHISQVYVKGIIDPVQPTYFNVTGPLTHAEAAVILLRMIDSTRRKPRMKRENTAVAALTPDQATALFEEHKKAQLLDVRSQEEYQESHLPNSVSAPLETMSQLNLEKETPLVLYCQKGFKSQLAAELLIEAGYTHVYTIPGIGTFDYKRV